MIEQIKAALATRDPGNGIFICSSRRDSTYIYVIDRSRKIYFTSTTEALRYNTLINDSGIRDLIKECAEKLGRKFIEAEYSDDFLANKQLKDMRGNWDPKALGLRLPDSGVRDVTASTNPSDLLNQLTQLSTPRASEVQQQFISAAQWRVLPPPISL